MNEAFIFQWHMLIYPLAALGYFELLRRLDSRWARRTPLTDEEFLSNYARSKGISEYDVFFLAAPYWSRNPEAVEEDFVNYLRLGSMPHYVRDYIRKLKAGDIDPAVSDMRT
jgi:predicted AAA+ superfamily ATPase